MRRRSVPKIGATPFGYRVAEQFGLAVVPPRPALVPLALKETAPGGHPPRVEDTTVPRGAKIVALFGLELLVAAQSAKAQSHSEAKHRVTVADTIRMILDDDPAPLRKLRLETPRDLEAIAMKCLAKAPGDRYRTARELADDLGRFLDGRPVGVLRRNSGADGISRTPK